MLQGCLEVRFLHFGRKHTFACPHTYSPPDHSMLSQQYVHTLLPYTLYEAPGLIQIYNVILLHCGFLLSLSLMVIHLSSLGMNSAHHSAVNLNEYVFHTHLPNLFKFSFPTASHSRVTSSYKWMLTSDLFSVLTVCIYTLYCRRPVQRFQASFLFSFPAVSHSRVTSRYKWMLKSYLFSVLAVCIYTLHCRRPVQRFQASFLLLTPWISFWVSWFFYLGFLVLIFEFLGPSLQGFLIFVFGLLGSIIWVSWFSSLGSWFLGSYLWDSWLFSLSFFGFLTLSF